MEVQRLIDAAADKNAEIEQLEKEASACKKVAEARFKVIGELRAQISKLQEENEKLLYLVRGKT